MGSADRIHARTATLAVRWCQVDKIRAGRCARIRPRSYGRPVGRCIENRQPDEAGRARKPSDHPAVAVWTWRDKTTLPTGSRTPYLLQPPNISSRESRESRASRYHRTVAGAVERSDCNRGMQASLEASSPAVGARINDLLHDSAAWRQQAQRELEPESPRVSDGWRLRRPSNPPPRSTIAALTDGRCAHARITEISATAAEASDTRGYFAGGSWHGSTASSVRAKQA